MSVARGTLTGIFFRPRRTLSAWAEAAPPTRWTLTRVTIPFIVASVVASAIAHDLIPQGFASETTPDPVGFGVYSALTQLAGVLALATAAHYLCDLFEGRSDFQRAVAAATVAMIPAWVGNVVAALPWPWGAHGSLALSIYSLVLLYPAFAVILGITRGNRVGHYLATMAAALLIAFAFGWQAVSLIPGAAPEVRLGTTWLI